MVVEVFCGPRRLEKSTKRDYRKGNGTWVLIFPLASFASF